MILPLLQVLISSKSCVTTIINFPDFAISCKSSTIRSICLLQSPLVGSSKITIGLFDAVAMANNKRCFSPPDKLCGCLSSLSLKPNWVSASFLAFLLSLTMEISVSFSIASIPPTQTF